MRRAVLTRLRDDGKQTLGELRIYDDIAGVWACKTLELPWLDNRQQVSCIPPGRYRVTPRFTPEKGHHFSINDVPGRSAILFHSGNFVTQIRGCILVGSGLVDINKDGEIDVVSSKITLNIMVQMLGMQESFALDIVAPA